MQSANPVEDSRKKWLNVWLVLRCSNGYLNGGIVSAYGIYANRAKEFWSSTQPV